MRRLLITGGAGFIGANFVHYWLRKHPEDRVVNLDCLTYAGNLENLREIENQSNYQFVHGDICEQAQVERLMGEECIDTVVHFAAESHVDRSIIGPEAFVRTNVNGTYFMLAAARAAWGKDKDEKRFVHVSTDEVYGSLGPNDPPFREDTPYAPNSPYAASKAAADHLVRAWYHTYGLPVLTTNCSNNYGPYQFPEKLIPLVIANALDGAAIPVYGDGANVRDWLYVEDHCSAIDAVLQHGRVGEAYNIGTRNEQRNIDVVNLICDTLDRLQPGDSPRRNLVTFVTDRPGHDRRYAMDPTKLETELGWRPSMDFAQGIEATVRWNLDNRNWIARVRDGAYRDYYERQYSSKS